MNNDELLQLIEAEQHNQETQTKVESEKVKFLVFSIFDKRYALEATTVREIVSDVVLYSIPFTPHYVRGLINRHGEPYSVFDLSMLFQGEPVLSNKYAILNQVDDQVAIIITDVLSFTTVAKEDIKEISNSDENTTFFSGSILFNGRDILIINVQSIINKLIEDLEYV